MAFKRLWASDLQEHEHLSTGNGRNSTMIGDFSWGNQKTVLLLLGQPCPGLQLTMWFSGEPVDFCQMKPGLNSLVGTYFLYQLGYILNSSCSLSSTVKSGKLVVCGLEPFRLLGSMVGSGDSAGQRFYYKRHRTEGNVPSGHHAGRKQFLPEQPCHVHGMIYSCLFISLCVCLHSAFMAFCCFYSFYHSLSLTLYHIQTSPIASHWVRR